MKHTGRSLILISCLVLALSACTKNGKFTPWWAKPASLDLFTPPPGPEIYQQGYLDGCQSGFKGYSSHYNKVWLTFKQDEKLRNNTMYYRVWKDAYAHCASYANVANDMGFTNYGAKPGFWQ